MKTSPKAKPQNFRKIRPGFLLFRLPEKNLISGKSLKILTPNTHFQAC